MYRLKTYFQKLATIYRHLLLIVIIKTNTSSMMRISKIKYMGYKYSLIPYFQRRFNLINEQINYHVYKSMDVITYQCPILN